MKENSEGCYHQLWRRQSNIQDIYPLRVGNNAAKFQRKWENHCTFQKRFSDTSL